MAEQNKKEPKEDSKETKEGQKKESSGEEKGDRNFGSLSSPEGTLMMFTAILLDCIGIFLLIFGLDDFGIADVFGIILIGGWMYSRSGVISMPQKAQKKARGWLRKLFRGKWKKYLTPFIGELVPYLGGIACCWTLAVYYELTD